MGSSRGELETVNNQQSRSTKNLQNQWNESSIHKVQRQSYGRALSTVFGDQQEKAVLDFDEDDDPVINNLRFLDYRYMRFCFHPIKDKFILGTGWKDPNWKDVKSIRSGLDGEERAHRALVFGRNLIEIEQKSIPQLLVSEVSILHGATLHLLKLADST